MLIVQFDPFIGRLIGGGVIHQLVEHDHGVAVDRAETTKSKHQEQYDWFSHKPILDSAAKRPPKAFGACLADILGLPRFYGTEAKGRAPIFEADRGCGRATHRAPKAFGGARERDCTSIPSAIVYCKAQCS